MIILSHLNISKLSIDIFTVITRNSKTAIETISCERRRSRRSYNFSSFLPRARDATSFTPVPTGSCCCLYVNHFLRPLFSVVVTRVKPFSPVFFLLKFPVRSRLYLRIFLFFSCTRARARVLRLSLLRDFDARFLGTRFHYSSSIADRLTIITIIISRALMHHVRFAPTIFPKRVAAQD